MKDALMTLESVERTQEPAPSDLEESAEQALFEEAKALRRRRWRYGGVVLAGVLALGAGLGFAIGAGAPTRSGSGIPASTLGPKVPRSSLTTSSSGSGALALKFSTNQAGLTGRVAANETSVSCTWVVPGVPLTAYLDSHIQPTEATWMWMGVTSYQAGSFIKVGVDAFTTSDATSVHYEAFWNLGATLRLHPVADLVAPGDEMRASISESFPGAEWVVTLADVTKGWRFQQTVSYRGKERFPLWFEEAPTHSNAQGARAAGLAPVKPVTFKHLRVNGKLPEPGRSTYVEMVNTTTGEAIVPRYTGRKASLTITEMSADRVLRHNPL